MDFSSTVKFLTTRLQQPLPGSEAHDVMRAHAVGSVIPNFTHKLPPKPGSVLILLYEEHGVVKFPLIKRPEYLGAHSGQISLPGGKAEQGETPIETALREGQEEVGVNPDDVTIIGSLSQFFVIPSNFIVTPIIGFIDKVPVFTPDEHEVAKILIAHLSELMETEAVKEKEILAAGRFTMRAPHFEVEGEVVWGATAMMLGELRTILREKY